MLLHDASHTLEHNFTRIFEELARFNMLEIYHRSLYDFRTSYQSRHLSPALYPTSTCTKRPHTASFKLSSRALRATNDYFTPIDNCGRLIRLCSSSNSITLFSRNKLISCTQSGCLLHQIMLRLFYFATLICRILTECILSSFLYITRNVVSSRRLLLLHVLTCFLIHDFIADVKKNKSIFLF